MKVRRPQLALQSYVEPVLGFAEPVALILSGMNVLMREIRRLRTRIYHLAVVAHKLHANL